MFRLFRGGLFVFALTGLSAVALAPNSAEAQLCRHLFDQCDRCCCRTCRMPPVHCTCTTFQPMVQTTYRPESVVTYRDVARVGTRQETHVETVPVTKLEQVTVDEGSYQMVWVPKPTTRTVAKTELQQRLAQRTVPYVYTERIPQVATRLVPQQTVHFLPQQTQFVMNGFGTTSAFAAPAIAVQPVVPAISASALPILGQPITSPATALSAPSLPSVPTTAASTAPWTTIPSRSTDEFSSGSGVELQDPIVPEPTPEISYEDSVKAPSAARVWQSTQRTVPARW